MFGVTGTTYGMGFLAYIFFKFIVQAYAYFDIGHNYFLISSVHTFDADGYTTS